ATLRRIELASVRCRRELSLRRSIFPTGTPLWITWRRSEEALRYGWCDARTSSEQKTNSEESAAPCAHFVRRETRDRRLRPTDGDRPKLGWTLCRWNTTGTRHHHAATAPQRPFHV